MAGTPEGAKKAHATMQKKYGKDHMSKIARRGKKGGDLSPGSFKPGDERTKKAAAAGGKASKRGPGKTGDALQDFPLHYEDTKAKLPKR